MDAAGNLDPTGILNATTAGVRLVGAVLNVAPAVKRAMDKSGGPGNPVDLARFENDSGEVDVNGMSTNAPTPQIAAQIQSLALQRVDPEKETRAYETVNYVLRTIGSRILEAKMVNLTALAQALTAATAHIEVKLFSGETNRLFQSLARKLNNVNLVNSVFTSIYLCGFLTAELTASLPNYKREYPALGPTLVQQMMRVAIGEDAFRENLTANLNAFQTVATTAGLLRPTDIGYSIFPDFPSFSPTRYSSKSMLDKASHKRILDNLVKHFDQHGFPQPLQGRDVGPIKDWRFLAGDTNSRAYEVEKADKQIGTNFGRVLYWLICSAHRMPAGMAVVAYLDQHIAMLRFLGPRFGYRLLNAGGDLNLSGPHLQMSKKLRATFDMWVVIMPSETVLAERRALSQSTSQAQSHAAPSLGQPPISIAPQTQSPVQISTSPPPMSGSPQIPQGIAGPSGSLPGLSAASNTARPSISSEGSSSGPSGSSHTQRPVSQFSAGNNRLAGQQMDFLEEEYHTNLLPPCNQFIANPPLDINSLKKEYFRLVESLQAGVLFKVDAIDPGNDDTIRFKRKGLVEAIQGTITSLDAVYNEATKVSSPPSRPESMASLPSLKPTLTGDQLTNAGPAELPASAADEVVYPNTNLNTHADPVQPITPNKINTVEAGFQAPAAVASPSSATSSTVGTPSIQTTVPAAVQAPALVSRPSVVRRKAPPPPKKVIYAKALYDFEPEDEEGSEELTFAEGDIIEIVEKNKSLEEDGWCRARVSGHKKIGLAPLDYLEELPIQPVSRPDRPSRVSSTSTTIPEQVEPDVSSPPPASKLDAKIDINVSHSNQTSHSAPNNASPALRPNISSQQSVNNQLNIDAANTGPPPPSYAESLNSSLSQTPGKPQAGSGDSAVRPPVSSGLQMNSQNPSSSPPVNYQGGPPPGKPQSGLSGSAPYPSNYGVPSRPSGPQYMPSPNRPGMYNPPYSNQYGGPQMYPGMVPREHVGAREYIQAAEAASGFAQAGAHIYAAEHSNNQSGGNQQQQQSITNIYNENDNNNNDSNNNNDNNNNNGTSTSTENDNSNNSTTNNDSNNTTTNDNNNDNSASNNNSSDTTANDNSNNSATNSDAINQNQNQNTSTNDPVSSFGDTAPTQTSGASDPTYTTPTSYPPDSTTSTSQGGDNVTYGFSPTYYPPATSTNNDPSSSGGFDLSPSYFPVTTSTNNDSSNTFNFDLGSTYYPPDTSLFNFGFDSFSSAENAVANTTTGSGLLSTASGPTTDPSTYATASATDASQYNFDFGTTNGNTVSPLAGLSPVMSVDPSQNLTGLGSVSPLAGLATPVVSDPGSGYGSDNGGTVSPFASMAISDSTTTVVSGDTTSMTSPLAGLAVGDSSTTDTSYFTSSTTVTGTTTSDTVSPLAGLASTSSIDSTTMTSTTDASNNYGTGFGYDSSYNATTTTSTEVDYSSAYTGGTNSYDYGVTTTTDYSDSYSYDF